MNIKELSIRTLVGIVGIPIIFGSIYLGNYFFLTLILIIQCVALYELFNLLESKSIKPLRIVGFVSLISITLSFYFLSPNGILCVMVLSFVLCLLGGLFRPVEGATKDIAATVFSYLYLSLLSCFILIRNQAFTNPYPEYNFGKLIMLVFIAIWVCDTFAYLFGSMLGKNPLFKRVSPNKTWEGGIAGLLGAILTVYFLCALWIPEMSLLSRIIIGFIVGFFGQLSDLIESLFKRDAGIKDSSNILPGHGGFLDRFDSPILIAPILYVYLNLLFFYN